MAVEQSGDVIEALPIWERDKTEICSVIARHKASFKIILKTKDEPRRLARWLDHHAGIVGVGNLIIFDNMSSDQDVLRIYEQLYGKCPIIRYGGFQDMLHQRRVNDSLYEALAQSCAYSTLIDTDEFLTLHDGEHFLTDTRIVDFVMSSHKTPILPGTWLDNLAGYNDRFLFSPPGLALKRGLKWGKPIVSTSIDTPDIVLHNTQLQDVIKATRLESRIFILHRKQVVPQERIRVNMLKLRALNVIPPGLSLKELLALDVNSFALGRTILSDIHALAALDGTLPPVDGSFQIDDQGVAKWQTPEQRQVFEDFFRDPLPYADQLFSPWFGGG